MGSGSQLLREAASEAGDGTVERDHAELVARMFGGETIELGGTEETAEPSTRAPTGRYVALDVLGRGGMGTVFRAYDARLHREVALKVVRVPARGEARLLREAQAMARLSHPNVVAVYDATVHEGKLCIVMECVTGQTLTRWLEPPRAPPEILAAFSSAARGLAAAHAAGLVHRDFKPANVLMADDGAVKVTDFGLAKLGEAAPSVAVDEDDMASAETGTDPTREGTIVGTPRYMSPEQHRGEPADARSDQFALCAALWEALCGEPAYQAETIDALAVAKARGAPAWKGPARLRGRVARALARGLSPDPAQRFSSIEELLRAIGPWRRSWAVLAGLAVPLVVGSVLAGNDDACQDAASAIERRLDADRHARIERSLTEGAPQWAADVWVRVDGRLDVWTADWADERARVCEAVDRGELSAGTAELHNACLRRALRRFDEALSLLERDDAGGAKAAIQILETVPSPTTCADADALRAEGIEGQEEAIEPIFVLLDSVDMLLKAALVDEAEARVDEAEVMALPLDSIAARARIAFAKGDVARARGEIERAAELYREAATRGLAGGSARLGTAALLTLAFIQAQYERDLETARLSKDVAAALAKRHSLPIEQALARQLEATIELSAGNLERARDVMAELVRDTPTIDGPWPHRSGVLDTYARILGKLGEHEAALEQSALALREAEERLGPAHPALVRSLLGHGVALRRAGRNVEAEKVLRRTLAIAEDNGDRSRTGYASLNLGNTIAQLRPDDPEALALIRRSVDLITETSGPDHPDTAMALNNLGQRVQAAGDPESAVEVFRRSLEIREKALGPGHPDVAHPLESLAAALRELGRLDEARAAGQRALAIREAKLGVDHKSVGQVLGHLSDIERDAGNLAEARALAERARSIAGAPPTDKDDLDDAQSRLDALAP